MTLALGMWGIGFEEATVLTIATLANTGPLIAVASSVPIDLPGLAAEARLLLCAAMVLGRLELLALIVMLSPELWRG
jgi:trk system potassium uptake protein TrkH